MSEAEVVDLEQIDLSISGMTCSSCVGRVEKSINEVPGARASVNLATNSAHILIPRGANPKDLIAAVGKAGYSAKLRGDGYESFSHSRAMGFRLSSAILLTIPVITLSMWHQLHQGVDRFILTQLDTLNIPAPLYSPTGWLVIALSAPVVLLIGWPIHRAAIKNLTHPSMDNLISLGSITALSWSIYANSTGNGDIYSEVGASVVTFIVLGRYLESRAKRKAGSSLAHLLSLAPKQVIIIRGGAEVATPISNLVIGDHCLVRAGQAIPTDGMVIQGSSAIDSSLLTGESLPIDVGPGSSVVAGALNLNSPITIAARRVGSDTELARITKMVLAAQGEKAPIQRLADKISNVFVPIVIALAIATFAAWYGLGNSLTDSMVAAVALLIIACPCALGLATPVALLVASGRGATDGVVLRKSSALEVATEIDTAIFDKTGTLTTGAMEVQNIAIADLGGSGPKISTSDLLVAVHSLEHESSHPIAVAIAKNLREQGIARRRFTDFIESAGMGIAARMQFGEQQMPVLIGTPASIRRATVSLHPQLEDAISSALARGNSVALAAVDGVAMALFEVGDSLRVDARETIAALKTRNIQSWLMSGDSQEAAREIAEQVGIPIGNVIAQATPDQKIAKVKELRSSGKKVLMIGDGINDAAALSEADLSMALGTGTDTAISSADITLMRATLATAITALNLSAKTLRIIRVNLGWAFIYNVIGIPIAALGLLNPMYAAAAMAASSLLVVLNSLRLNGALKD
ncbi:MAG: heavy metal translocating P-type ATPase [Actinobacteria bacterium]|nr:heavy metal translocating P-type ATPase [Actinomycetota bacterium]